MLFSFCTADGEYAAGDQFERAFEGLAHEVTVRMPDDFDEERRWPAVFHYHGTGGRPNSVLPERYCNRNGFVFVGMAYAVGAVPSQPGFIDAQWKHFVKVREVLLGTLPIDPGRIYVGGFSKGGWTASGFVDSHADEFAGSYVLGAGANDVIGDTRAAGLGRHAVYIGVGETEVNFPYSIRARERWRRRGARVTFDTYLAAGHIVPTGGSKALSVQFQQWWAIEGQRHDPAPVREQAEEWVRSRLQTASSVEDPADRWILLGHLSESLFLRVASRPLQEDVKNAFKRADSAMARERDAGRRFKEIASADAQGEGWDHRRSSAEKFLRITQDFPGTHFGARATLAYNRLRTQVSDPSRWGLGNGAARDRFLQKMRENVLPEVDSSRAARQLREAWEQMNSGG